MTLRHRIRFYQRLALLIRSGLPIRAVLERLKEQLREREVSKLSKGVNEGERLGDAFVHAGFSPFECHLVVAGEKSGQLDFIFEHLAEFWKKRLEMRQAFIRPLIYPIVVLHLALVMGAVIESVTGSPQAAVAHLILWLVLIYFTAFIIYLFVRMTRSAPLARYFWQSLPIIGGVIKATYAYRWITALRLEFTAGISLSKAVADAWRASGYIGCEKFAEEGEQAMREGMELSKLVHRWRRLPRDWIDFIETGEVSGQLEAAFKNLEAEAERAWTLAEQRMAEWLPKITYFIIIVIAGAAVGRLLYQVTIAPIVNAESVIDSAMSGH